MLAQIRNLKRSGSALLLLAGAMTFVSCASQKEQVALVNDPDAKHESQLPWNKQEKWEVGGSLSNMTDRR
jgi:hypothetical protein